MMRAASLAFGAGFTLSAGFLAGLFVWDEWLWPLTQTIVILNR